MMPWLLQAFTPSDSGHTPEPPPPTSPALSQVTQLEALTPISTPKVKFFAGTGAHAWSPSGSPRGPEDHGVGGRGSGYESGWVRAGSAGELDRAGACQTDPTDRQSGDSIPNAAGTQRTHTHSWRGLAIQRPQPRR